MKPQTKKIVYRGRIVNLDIERHPLPGGAVHDYEVVHHVPAAAVVPVLKNEIFLIHQYRPPLRRSIWEIPAGLLEKGETPLACVRRELVEEIGYRGKNFHKLGEIFTGAGFCDEKIYLYCCEVGRKVGTAHEGTETIEVHCFTKAQVKRMLARGQIQDAKTAVALFVYFSA